jgi:hypothetical protein
MIGRRASGFHSKLQEPESFYYCTLKICSEFTLSLASLAKPKLPIYNDAYRHQIKRAAVTRKSRCLSHVVTRHSHLLGELAAQLFMLAFRRPLLFVAKSSRRAVRCGVDGSIGNL